MRRERRPGVTLATLLRQGRRLRTLGIDDGPFRRGRRSAVLVVGAVYSGCHFEGLLATTVRQDGWNATSKLIDAIGGSKFRAQLHLVLLDGITLAGFNVVDLPALAGTIGIPCAAVMRRPPRLAAIHRALSKLPAAGRRRDLLARAGPVHDAGPLVFQCAGAEPEVVGKAILGTLLNGFVPESLRAAHLIASGIVSGESARRA